MYSIKLPHVSSLPKVWGIALWQHAKFTEVMERTLWSIKTGRSAVFFNTHLCENKTKSSSNRTPSNFSIVLGEQQKHERWKEADTYTLSTPYWLRDVTYHSLHIYQNWQGSIENRNPRHVWFKTYLGCLINNRTLNSSSNKADIKNTSTNERTTFSASSAFHRFLKPALSGSTPYHNALSIKISSDRTS